jgi:hypothetical protein
MLLGPLFTLEHLIYLEVKTAYTFCSDFESAVADKHLIEDVVAHNLCTVILLKL